MKKGDIKKIALICNPSKFLDYRKFLAALYEQSTQIDSALTYKQFAELLGFPASNVLDHVIKGRRPLSTKGGERINRSLYLKASERDYLLELIQYTNSRSSTERDAAFENMLSLKDKALPEDLSKSELEYFTEWYHMVIGEMTKLVNFNSDPEWIAKTIVPRIRPEQARKSLDLLMDLGIIEYDKKNKRHVRTSKDPSTGHETEGLAVTSFHKQMSDISKNALKMNEGVRDLSAMTLCLDEKTFEEIKTSIHKFQRKVLEQDGKVKSPETVYQLNIQLFPFMEK